MKRIMCLVVFVLMSAVVLAEDVTVHINGNDISGTIDVSPGGSLEIEHIVGANVLVKDVSVESDNEVIRQIIEYNLREVESDEREPEQTSDVSTVNLPDTMPSGEYDVKVIIKYSDASFQSKETSKSATINVVGGSGMIGFLTGIMPDAAASEIVDLMTDRELEPVDKNLNSEDVRNVADELGLSDADVINKNYDVKLIDEKSADGTISDEKLNEVISTADGKLKEELEKIKGMEKPTIKKSLNVYEITTKDGSKTAYQSKVIISVSFGGSLNNLNLVEEIPKEVADNVNVMAFSEKPEIIQADPIVKWNFDHVPEGQKKEYSYIVNDKLEKIDSNTYAGGTKPGFFSNLITKIVKMFMGGE